MANHALSILLLSIATALWVTAVPTVQVGRDVSRRDLYGLAASPESFGAFLDDQGGKDSLPARCPMVCGARATKKFCGSREESVGWCDTDAIEPYDQNGVTDDRSRHLYPSAWLSQARPSIHFSAGPTTLLLDDADAPLPDSGSTGLLPSDEAFLKRFVKRNIDEIDRTAFDNFFKRNLNQVNRIGWSGFVKRLVDYLATSNANVLERRG